MSKQSGKSFTPGANRETFAVLNGGTTAKAINPCNSCRWRVWDGSNSRCHVNPPQIRIPYENLAAWPVVPETGGGCRQHEERT